MKFTDQKEICDFIEQLKITALDMQKLKKKICSRIDVMWEDNMKNTPRMSVLKQLAKLRHDISKLGDIARIMMDKHNAFIDGDKKE